MKISNLFKSKAYGRKMPDFFNCTVKLKTLFDEFELLKLCSQIEKTLKREFVIKPISEIAPYFIHPINKKTMIDLANSFL